MHFDEKRKQLCNLENKKKSKKNIPDIEIGNSLDSGSEILRSGFFRDLHIFVPIRVANYRSYVRSRTLRLILCDHPERNILRNSTLL